MLVAELVNRIGLSKEKNKEKRKAQNVGRKER
jgi:hypothetical protein